MKELTSRGYYAQFELILKSFIVKNSNKILLLLVSPEYTSGWA